MNDTQHWEEPAGLLELTEVTDLKELPADSELRIEGQWVKGPFELARILWTFANVEADTGLVIRWGVEAGYQYAPVNRIDGWRNGS